MEDLEEDFSEMWPIWMFPKIRVPKMDGENNGKPLWTNGWFGGKKNLFFGVDTHIFQLFPKKSRLERAIRNAVHTVRRRSLPQGIWSLERPLSGSLVVGPLPNGLFRAEINEGDPNHWNLTGMILQVAYWHIFSQKGSWLTREWFHGTYMRFGDWAPQIFWEYDPWCQGYLYMNIHQKNTIHLGKDSESILVPTNKGDGWVYLEVQDT